MRWSAIDKALKHPPFGDIYSENYVRYINGACKEVGENPDPENIQPCTEWVLYRKLCKLNLFPEQELYKLKFKELKELNQILCTQSKTYE